MRNKTIRELFPDMPGAKESSTGFNGSMMLAVDDPLRDTPEKAERYAQLVGALSERQRAKATEADVAAALKLLGSHA